LTNISGISTSVWRLQLNMSRAPSAQFARLLPRSLAQFAPLPSGSLPCLATLATLATLAVSTTTFILCDWISHAELDNICYSGLCSLSSQKDIEARALARLPQHACLNTPATLLRPGPYFNNIPRGRFTSSFRATLPRREADATDAARCATALRCDSGCAACPGRSPAAASAPSSTA